ncbi:dehydrogenase/reductase SDR family member 4-like [Notechis scutatus]|uniref:Dehydrogenase/reductase SDR family member 4-like n=1 Tax=Notechis scutatus TaxID=8663 RepID=A0A6J1V812_9SAUR|nr:dehydrogenase/reductase SDR family member 4-like [Notechis scutatus]
MQRALLSGCSVWSRFARMSSVPAGRSLAEKVALVTASTEGIGLAIARRLAQDGAHVLVSSRKQAKVDQTVSELQAENLSVSGLVCHVGKSEDRQHLVDVAMERYGGIDILVCNAAVNPFFGNMLDASEEVWDKILDINVKATALLINLVAPHMQKRGNGSIVIVSSVAGYMPFPNIGPYNVSKTALLGLTRNLAIELAPHIRVNCVAPGLIRTKFSASFWQDENMESKALEVMRIRRLGDPTDCSGIVSFLCSAEASYITGETVAVAGGMLSHL